MRRARGGEAIAAKTAHEIRRTIGDAPGREQGAGRRVHDERLGHARVDAADVDGRRRLALIGELGEELEVGRRLEPLVALEQARDVGGLGAEETGADGLGRRRREREREAEEDGGEHSEG